MTTLVDAVALTTAYLDRDRDAVAAIAEHSDVAELCAALLDLSVQLGVRACGSEQALREVLGAALTVDIGGPSAETGGPA